MKTSTHMDRYAKAMLTIIAGCLAWLCCSDLLLPPRAAAQSSIAKSKRVLEAQEFRLVDETGSLRALLTLHPGTKAKPQYEDKPGLYLYGANGTLRARLYVGDDRPALDFRDENQKRRASLHVTAHRKGGSLYLSDQAGNHAILGTATTHDEGDSDASSLRLFDKNDRLLWAAP